MPFRFNPFTHKLDVVDVTAIPPGTVVDLKANDGTSVAPDGAGNINVYGNGVVGSGVSTAGNIYTTGSGSTLTINETKAQFLTNYTSTNVDHAHTPYTATLTDNFISVDCSGGVVTVKLPDSPTPYRVFTIKDRAGNAGTSNITVTTVGGAVNIDGATSYVININFEAASFVFNGTSYEVY